MHSAQCTAKSKRSGEQCKNRAVKGSSKCRMHGGSSLSGIASPSFKTGRYSKHLPTRLAGRYGEALSDPQLLELRDEIALVGTRMAEVVEGLDQGESAQRWAALRKAYIELRAAVASGEAADFQSAMTTLGAVIEQGNRDHEAWAEIVELAEQRRKLAESERKRLIELQQTITAEQAMTMLALIVDTVRKHVSDPATLAAISDDIRQIATN